MNNIGQALHKESYEDILSLVEDLILMENSFRKHKHTGYEESYRRLVKNCKEKLDKEIKIHNEEFLDELNVSKLKDLIKGLGLRVKEAILMIEYIEKSKEKLSDSELDFINDMKVSTKSRLSPKQTMWLLDIYGRVYS